MDYNQAALQMHEEHHGKVAVQSKVKVENRDDLSTAYTPGVAEPCRRIHADPRDVYRYTTKGNLVAVVSDGTAVLGLARWRRCLSWRARRFCSRNLRTWTHSRFVWIRRTWTKLYGR